MIAAMAMELAMPFVLSAGEIDLSVGVIAGLAARIAVGCFHRWLTTRIGIPSFLASLAMVGIAKGVTMWLSDTAAVPIFSPGNSWLFGGGLIGPTPVLLFWMRILGALGHIASWCPGFGRRVPAPGVRCLEAP